MCVRATSTASGSAKVVTNDDRFSIGFASVQAKLFKIACAARAAIPVAGNVSRGTGMLNWSNAVTFADAASLSGDLRVSSAPAIGNLLLPEGTAATAGPAQSGGREAGHSPAGTVVGMGTHLANSGAVCLLRRPGVSEPTAAIH